MEITSPMKPGSTRCSVRCEECQAQKKGCKPLSRNWLDKKEKCNRCKRLGLLCGPNLTAKEHKRSLAGKACSRESGQTLRQNSDTNERFPSPYSPSSGSPRINSNSSSNAEFSRVGFANSTPNGSLTNESELLDMLRTLSLNLERWLYFRTVLRQSSERVPTEWLSIPVTMEQNRIYSEIISIVDRVEDFGDKANRNGSLCQAQVAYRCLIDKMRQMDEHDRANSLVLKLAKFNLKNNDDVQARDTLRLISTEGQLTLAAENELKAMLLKSYAKSSQSIKDLCRGTKHFGNIGRKDSDLEIEDPYPALHRAIQDKVPVDLLSELHSLQPNDNVDIIRRYSIHVAIEEGNVELIDKLLQDNRATVNKRDFFSRTPLHIAVQRRCEQHTNLSYTTKVICSQAHVCQLLIDAGANLNARDAAQCTILEAAARTGCLYVVEKLLIGIRDKETVDVQNFTPSTQTIALRAAAEEGNDDVVRMLQNYGAEASYVGPDGKMAHDFARESGHCALAASLEKAAEEEKEWWLPTSMIE